jgi:hypothetical protein
MLDLRDKAALQDLARQFEESAALGEYPASCAGELMLLADVCGALGLGEQDRRQVLGDPAVNFLAELIGDRGAL